jgi:beta-carotene 3-hydroxylase
VDYGMLALNTVLFLAGAAAMELVAWAVHKWVMHGLLWVLHEDHHRPHKGLFEKNDLFVLFFAGVSFGLIFGGASTGLWGVFWFGLGTALYGILYTIFHDVLFHKRIKMKAPKWAYLKRIVNAHRVHHSGRDDQRNAKAYGFLWASRKYDQFPPSH